MQHSPQNYGKLAVQRLRLFQDLSEFSPLSPQLYDFWLRSLRVFIDFDQIFNVSEEQYFTEFVPYDQLVDYFKIGVGFVKNDVGRTVEILNLLIQNLRKQNELLLKVFLTVLNNYYREIYTDSVFKMNSAGKYPSLYSQLVNVQSREMYVLFLTQLLFIETTY